MRVRLHLNGQDTPIFVVVVPTTWDGLIGTARQRLLSASGTSATVSAAQRPCTRLYLTADGAEVGSLEDLQEGDVVSVAFEGQAFKPPASGGEASDKETMRASSSESDRLSHLNAAMGTRSPREAAPLSVTSALSRLEVTAPPPLMSPVVSASPALALQPSSLPPPRSASPAVPPQQTKAHGQDARVLRGVQRGVDLIEAARRRGDVDTICEVMSQLAELPPVGSMTAILTESGVGVVVGSLQRDADARVAQGARVLVGRWKALVEAEARQSANEERVLLAEAAARTSRVEMVVPAEVTQAGPLTRAEAKARAQPTAWAERRAEAKAPAVYVAPTPKEAVRRRRAEEATQALVETRQPDPPDQCEHSEAATSAALAKAARKQRQLRHVEREQLRAAEAATAQAEAKAAAAMVAEAEMAKSLAALQAKAERARERTKTKHAAPPLHATTATAPSSEAPSDALPLAVAMLSEPVRLNPAPQRGPVLIDDYACDAQGVRMVDSNWPAGTLLRGGSVCHAVSGQSTTPDADPPHGMSTENGAGQPPTTQVEAEPAVLATSATVDDSGGLMARSSGGAPPSKSGGGSRLELRAGSLVVGAPLRQGRPSPQDMALGLVCAASSSSYYLRFMWRQPADGAASRQPIAVCDNVRIDRRDMRAARYHKLSPGDDPPSPYARADRDLLEGGQLACEAAGFRWQRLNDQLADALGLPPPEQQVYS